MGQAMSISGRQASPLRRSVRNVIAELKGKLRTRAAREARRLIWSVNIGELSDVELDQVLTALAEAGYRGSYTRELSFIAHFEFDWRTGSTQHRIAPRESSNVRWA